MHNIIKAFEKSKSEYQKIQKSKHWESFDRRGDIYKEENLVDFRNNHLSEGLDPIFPLEEQREIYSELKDEVGDEYVQANLSDKNIGNNKHIFIENGLVVDGGQNYQIRWMYDLEPTFANNRVGLVCEIGGGYGAFAQKIHTRFGSKIILIDLPEANLLSAYYLSRYFPEARFLLADGVKNRTVTKEDIRDNDFIIIPPWYTLEEGVEIDMFINTRSFMEMNFDVIKGYFALIQAHTRIGGFFLNLNRYHKASVGYPIELAKYPYDERWGVVLSKEAWRQPNHHFLLTKRLAGNGDIKQELRDIARIGAQHTPKHGLIGKVKNVLNRFRYQYFS